MQVANGLDRRDLFRGGLLLSATVLATSGCFGGTAARLAEPLGVSTSGEGSAAKARGLNGRLIYRRAVIWGLPLVSEDTAAFRGGNASYNDIAWWPKGGGWKNQSPAPNVTTRYISFFINTRQDGPVVVELPPAVPGATFYGTIKDAWHVPLVDIGLHGKGGKYLVPPDFNGDVPDGYVPVRPATYGTMTLLRSVLASLWEDDVAAHLPAQRLLDMTESMFDGLLRYDETLFANLACMLDEEPAQPHDLQMMGMLLPLGIEKGKVFKPEDATLAQMRAAAAEAHAWLMEKAATDVTPFLPDGETWQRQFLRRNNPPEGGGAKLWAAPQQKVSCAAGQAKPGGELLRNLSRPWWRPARRRNELPGRSFPDCYGRMLPAPVAS